MEIESIVLNKNRLTWRDLVRWMFFFVFLAIWGLFGGCVVLYTAYFQQSTLHIERPVIAFVLCVYIFVLALVFVIGNMFNKAFHGLINEKPFQRIVPVGWKEYVYEILSSNGKYYLRRLYGFEILESLYQINNYRLYACLMATPYLFVYCFIMSVALGFQLYAIRKVKQNIKSQEKKTEIIVDIFLELFCTVFPANVVYFVHGIYFTDNEIVQIVSFPLFAFGLKLLLIVRTEIVVALDDIRIRKLTTDKNKRRSSFATREQALISIQNEHFNISWKKALLGIYGLFFFFYVTLTCVHFGSLFMTTPSHFMYCKVNVPTCNYWIVPQNNCLKISHLSTKESSDFILNQFTESTAAVDIAGSNMEKLQIFKRFNQLRKLVIFKSNSSYIDIDYNTFSNLNQVVLSGFTKATRAHDSFFRNKLSKISYSHMPKLKLEDFHVPNANLFELFYVGKSLGKVNAPDASTLALVGYSLTKMPEGLMDEVSFLKINDNNFTSLSVKGRKLMDVRYNKIKKLPKGVRYSFAHGNTVCPDSWNCKKFCHPKCSSFIHTTQVDKNCAYDCVHYCGIGKCKEFIN